MRIFKACAYPFKLFISLIMLIAFLNAIYGCGGGDGGGGGSVINNPVIDGDGANSNTTLTGYLYDNQAAPSLEPAVSASGSPSRASVASRSIALVLNQKEYTSFTDGEGFWKMDVEALASTSVAILKIKNSKTNLYDSTEISFAQGQTHMMKLFVEADSKLKVLSKQLGLFVANQSISITKAAVTQKFEEIKASGSNVPVISGLVVSDLNAAPSLGTVSKAVSTSEKPYTGIPGVRITLSGNNQGMVTLTDQYGAFAFNGIFISGTYTLKAEKAGYPDQAKTVTILSDSYGFAYSGVLFKMNIPVLINTAPSITILSFTNNSSEVSVNYNLSDAEGDSCSVKVYYSIDSGVNYSATTAVTGDTAGVIVGNNRSLKWLSSQNIASSQSGVKVRLIPNDGKTDGAAIETQVFSITPKVLKPVFTPAGGAYSSTQNVTITTATSGASIKYTTDGSIPSSSAGLTYSGPLTVATATTIRAVALKDGFIASDISDASYTFDLSLASLASWDFNLQTGQLTLNFNKTMKPSTINITQVKLLNAKSGSVTYSLTNSSASTADNASITITLSSTDLNAIKSISGLAKNLDTSYLGLGASAIKDTGGNYAKPVLDADAVKAANYVSESTNPLLSLLSVSSNNASPAKAKTGDIITLQIKPRDTLTAAPTAKIAGKTASVASAANNTYNATYTMLSTDTEGTVAVFIDFTTPAAVNVQATATTDSSSVYFDKTLPTVTMSYSKDPSKAGQLTITATYSEDVKLGEIPDISIDQKGSSDLANAAMTQGITRKIWSYAYTVNQADGSAYIDGTAAVSLSTVHDEAGNNAAAPYNNIFTIDTTAPAAPSAPTAAAGPEINSVEEQQGFSVVAPLGSSGAAAGDSIELLVNGAAFPAQLIHALTAAEITAGSYTFQVVSGQLGSVGSKNITSRITDAAGNTGAASPALALTYSNVTSLSMQYYSDAGMTLSLGDSPRLSAGTYYIKVTSSETVSAAPTIAIDAEGSLNDTAETTLIATPSGDTKNFYMTRIVVADTYAVGLVKETITLKRKDYTGTVSNDSGTRSAYTDTTKPILSSVTIASDGTNTAKAKTGNKITLSITASEALKAAPTVTIAGQAATVTGTGPYTAAYTTQASDAEGVVAFSIGFTDLAGIPGTAVTSTTNSSSVTFDKTVPTLTLVKISSSPTPGKAKPGDVVTFNLTASEALSANPTVKLFDFRTATVTAGGVANTYVASYTMQSSDNTEGVILFKIDFADSAYNAGIQVNATTDLSSVTYDGTLPTLSAVTIASNNATNSLAKTGDVITLSLTATEALTASPTVTIDGKAAVLAGAGPYTATYTMTAADIEGYMPFTVDFKDAAGNSGAQVTATTNGSKVRFDRTAPSISSTHTAALSFDNNTGIVKAIAAMTYPETCEIQIYVGALNPPLAATAQTAAEAAFINSRNANTSVIAAGIGTGLAAGSRIYYRFIDQAGNTSAWLSDGTIPAAPVLPANTALALLNDGGTGAPAGTINSLGTAVTLRPGLTLAANEELTLSITDTAAKTISMKVRANAASVTPIFGAGTSNASYTVVTNAPAAAGSATTGSFNVTGNAMAAGNLSVSGQLTDANSNISSPTAAPVTLTLDTVKPQLSTWSLDRTNARLTLNFGAKTVKANSLAVAGNITIQELATVNNANKYTLQSSTSASADGVSIQIDLSAADKTAIFANTNIATSTANSYILITQSLINDVSGNPVTAITNGSALQATGVASDIAPPPDPSGANLAFDNSTGKIIASALLNYTETAYLDVYIGAGVPVLATAPTVSESTAAAGHALNDVIISGITTKASGLNIYYRLRDVFGNSSNWVADGTVPVPPTAASITVHAGDTNLANFISNTTQAAPFVSVTPAVNTNDNNIFATISDGTSTITNTGTVTSLAGASAALEVAVASAAGLANGALTVKAYVKDTTTGNISSISTGTSGTKNISSPVFSIQYYSDLALTTKLSDNPRLKAGTYYIKITSDKALSAAPTITIVSEGAANDALNAATALVSGNDYKYTRPVGFNALAVGTVIENISVSGTDLAGNASTAVNPSNEAAKAAYTDTVGPVITVKYYTDSTLLAAVPAPSIGVNPKLKTGAYYLKITSDTPLAAAPTVTLNSEGVNNDITNAATALVAGNVYKYTRSINPDSTATGTVVETITITAADLAGNAAANDATVANCSAKIRTNMPSFDMQYYSDNLYTVPVTGLSSQKAGTFYLELTSKDANVIPAVPTINIYAEGTLNDITSAATVSKDASNNVYRYVRTINVDALAAGNILEVIGVTATDDFGNSITNVMPSNISTKGIFTDTKAPVLTAVSIASNNAASSSTALAGNEITLSFTASEAFAALPVVTIDTKAAVVTAGSNNTYTAKYTMLITDAEGVLPFTINFSDKAANAGVQVTATTNSSAVTFKQTQKVTAVNTAKPDGSYKQNDLIDLTVTFDGPVTVTGTPLLALSDAVGNASYVASGSTTTNLIFRYTVGAAVTSPDLTYAATNSLTLNGGTINDAAGNAAALTLPAIAVFSGAHAIVIDTTAPGDPTAELGKLKFINGATTGVVDAAAVAYPAESCYLELYVGPLTPPLPETAPTATEISARAASAVVTSADLFAPHVISTKTSGDKIYYRFKDIAGNASAWAADGSIPTQPSSLPAVTALILAADGGAGAPAGYVNNAGKAAVKIRPGIMINNGEVLTLTVSKGASTITATATAAANSLTPVFGVPLANVAFAGHITGGAAVGAVDFTANGGITEASDIAASVKVIGAGGNESKTVSINTISYSTTAPTLTTWSLSKTAGNISLTLNFSKSVKASSFTPTGVTVQNSIAPTQSRVLSAGTTTASADGTSIVVTLNSADATDINSKTSLATSTADSYLSITMAAITDIYGNPVTAIVPGSALQAASFNDTTPPAAPDTAKLIFNNATGKVLATGALSYSEPAKLEVYFGTSVPASSAAGVLEASYASSHILNDAIITPVAAQTAGNTIYYRLVDTAGNKSGWVPDGTVPAPPTLPPSSSLIMAGDGGTGAYPGTVNNIGKAAVTLRPGVTLNSGMSLSLRANETVNTSELKAVANANNVTPIFGGTTLFTTYSVTTGSGNAPAGSGNLNFSGSGINAGTVNITASITDAQGNISAFGTAVAVNYDITSPDNLSNAARDLIYFDNETGKVISSGTFTYLAEGNIASGYIEIYIGPAGPLASTPGIAIESVASAGHNDTTNNIIISAIPRQTPGVNGFVYYRFVDLAGNKSVAWIADGSVPYTPTATAIKVGASNSANYISSVSQGAPVVTVTPNPVFVANDQLFATVSDTSIPAKTITNIGIVNNTGAAADVTLASASAASLIDGALTVKSYNKNSASGNSSAIFAGTAGAKDIYIPELASWSMDMYSNADAKSITMNFSESILPADLTVTSVRVSKTDNTGATPIAVTAVKTQNGQSIKITKLGAQFVYDVHLNVWSIKVGDKTNYYLNLLAGAFKDAAGNASASLASPAMFNPTQFLQDTLTPIITGAASSTANLNGSNLIIQYNDYMSIDPANTPKDATYYCPTVAGTLPNNANTLDYISFSFLLNGGLWSNGQTLKADYDVTDTKINKITDVAGNNIKDALTAGAKCKITFNDITAANNPANNPITP